MKTCAQCRFYVPTEPASEALEAESMGECRRNPPIGNGDHDPDQQMRFIPTWPRTRSDCFCGEFQPRPRT